MSDSLCPWPFRAGGEFYPILSQITTMNHDNDIFSTVTKGSSNCLVQKCLLPNYPNIKLSGAKLS